VNPLKSKKSARAASSDRKSGSSKAKSSRPLCRGRLFSGKLLEFGEMVSDWRPEIVCNFEHKNSGLCSDRYF
jgi:hypothetical protein